jgi:hypothetical protein
MLSRTYYESQKKPIYVSRPTTVSDADLGFRGEVADSLEGGSGHNSEDHANRPELLPHSRAEHAIRQRQEIDLD